MPVELKSPLQLQRMRRSGQLLTQVFDMLDEHMQAGISTMQVNHLVERFIIDELKARPASKGQYDYPYVLNSSRNEVVCHGMPSSDEYLQDGDIINIDITLEKDGYIADSSKMYCIGQVSDAAQRLVDTTYDALWAGIDAVKPGARLGDVGHAIQKLAERAGYSVVREFCGHGIGQQMHQAPEVLHYGRPNTGLVLQPGMTFTIEPMINQGKRRLKHLDDGWTVITRDKQLSAQWEHTLAVTEDGVEVLTLRKDETRHPGSITTV
ncbi:type I methionyl aminopeptidase [Bacterioplanes sanyensis]|uniref:Methionine aminopeptidase n=1 Tax=Bacterioplanes sanyensis TaxID=1249553 RepID=A0A222FNC9_9GAMM|nr:type I methionyl aminopeptidase [Bacterioplanes sanyensis]ASP40537.1 type I methionyl aminopeptidase [Bacterioplanes sanyensis]